MFSVIIPTYNRAESLKRALNSLAKQTFTDFEVIVCDDGSTDHTKEIVNCFASKFPLQYFWEENWGGPARPRNNGLRIAKGEWICFLDADDWWYPNKIEIAEKYLHSADIVYHDLDIYTPKSKRFIRKIRGRHLKKPVFVDLIRKGNAIANSSVVVRKSIIEQLGGFSEDKSLLAIEDFDLWLRISRITEKFTYIPKTLGAYWSGGGNITEVSEKQIARFKELYNRYFEFLTGKDRKQSEILMNYMIGRTMQRMGLLDEALELLKISARSKDFNIKLKSIISIILIRISFLL